MTLFIAQSLVNQLQRHAQEAAPLEACGLLAGVGDRLERFYPLTNMDQSAEHFSMAPEEQFAAIKDMRAHNLQLLAIWHSHPATPARMSDEDLRLAYTPNMAYLISSLVIPPDQISHSHVDQHTPVRQAFLPVQPADGSPTENSCTHALRGFEVEQGTPKEILLHITPS